MSWPIGVTVSVVGAALFLRYSVASFLRFWLARFIYEQQSQTDRIVEKLDRFERFHPDRMAQRILGMGDVMTLIEKAEGQFDADEAAEREESIA